MRWLPPASACCAGARPGVTTCGDITAFKIDPTTGRLTLVVNAQVTSASGSALPYFPVPANPIDFVLTASLHAYAQQARPPLYRVGTGDVVFPYTYNSGSGPVDREPEQPAAASTAGAGTAIVSRWRRNVYVLDNEPITIGGGSTFAAGTYTSQILPFTVGTGGALQAQTGGAVPDRSER